MITTWQCIVTSHDMVATEVASFIVFDTEYAMT